ncbi:hypothetical protein [Rhodococcus sp. ARC_M6]|uniref:hypothetical protein n=1 Tax=Rhodococcus sp. ARC_M6 TaxID=2928852 RepID=UPI001FB50CB3|nr:hypothetical protein [Rhodococcus sp. ARC_M6]MCJ0907039.1 hypothetical protein [Rhodococcus sp. ARC_M6]
MTSTGEAACEIHPDVFVDECGRAFTTDEAVVADAGIAVVTRLPEEDEYVFVVDDEVTELAVNWIEVLSGDPMAVWLIEQRHTGQGDSSARIRPDIDWALLPRRDERTVQFELRATHRAKSSRELACEIYPDVFVVERGAVFSRRAGMASQQPGDIVDPLTDCAQDWFIVRGLKKAVNWVTTVARIRAERRAGPAREVW